MLSLFQPYPLSGAWGCEGHASLALVLDVEAVAATLDKCPFFTLGLVLEDPADDWVWSDSKTCWWATVMHHHCRVMCPPEAPCEGKGSFIRLLWSSLQGRMAPSELSDRVLLAQAGVKCCGSVRDEEVVRVTSNVYVETSAYKVRMGTSYNRGLKTVNDNCVNNLTSSGRRFTHLEEKDQSVFARLSFFIFTCVFWVGT